MTSPTRPLTRRQVLAGGTAAATLGLSSRLGHLVERAYAAEPTKCAPLSDIEHVIFVMQENRSFDHYFGRYPGARGFDDPHAIRQGDGSSVFAQKGYPKGPGHPNGTLLPFHLNTRQIQTFTECLNDITHDWQPQHRALNHGRMDQWVTTHLADDGSDIGPLTMGYYDRSDLAFYYALADAFTLCDAYHCSVIGPTDPNRVMWFSATLDPDGKHGGPVLETLVTNRVSEFGKLNWRTMPENLHEAGVSWRVYQDQSDTTLLNPLPYFKAYADNTLSPFYANAFGEYTYPGTFQADVIAGTLPQVSWVFPDFAACEHPSAPPSLGEAFIAQLLETLLLNPGVWEKTAVFVMYDENGGFFDHVAPPRPPAGTDGEFLTMDPLPATADGVRGPVGLGFRVPCLVLSPYARGGLVCSDVFDHTSQLKFLETRFGVDVPNLSRWRRKTVGDLTGAFNFAHRPRTSVPSLPQPAADAGIIAAECAVDGPTGVVDKGPLKVTVPANAMPHQEHGTRGRPSGLPSSCEAPPKPVTHRTSSSSHRAGHHRQTTHSATGALAMTGGNERWALGALGLTAAGLALRRLRSRLTGAQVEDSQLVERQ